MVAPISISRAGLEEHSRRGRRWRSGIAVLALLIATFPALGAQFCCTCKGQASGADLEAKDDLSATFECSLACRRPTIPSPGQCQAAAPPATSPRAASAGSGGVLLYQSADCSGTPVRFAASAGRVAQEGARGAHSFTVESGATASVFEKPEFGGRYTAPVAGSLCVSPDFEIASVRLHGR